MYLIAFSPSSSLTRFVSWLFILCILQLGTGKDTRQTRRRQTSCSINFYYILLCWEERLIQRGAECISRWVLFRQTWACPASFLIYLQDS